MTTEIEKARELLKSAKQQIKKNHGWTSKDYLATVHVTNRGIKLRIKLLKPKRGFKIICGEIQKIVNVPLGLFDATHKNILEEVRKIIERDYKNGKLEGNINGMDWKISSTTDRYFRVKNASADFVNRLYTA